MLWHRAAADAHLLFGAQLNLDKVVEQLRDYVQLGTNLQREVCVALLDDTGKPVALSHPGFRPRRSGALAQGRSPHLLAGTNITHPGVVQPARESGEGATGDPIVNSRPEWKHPFVASEVGEVLPHWEVAVYLFDPAKAGRSATTLRFTLGLLIALLVLAI